MKAQSIDISGYARQDYLLDRALQEEITVHPNSRVQHYLEKYLVQILGELQRLKARLLMSRAYINWRP